MKYTAIFCGYFSISQSNPSIMSIDEDWKPIVKDADAIRQYENYYYPEFVAFNYGVDDSQSLVRYKKDINKSITISRNVSGDVKSYCFSVCDITIYVAPHDMLMYSIRIENECDDFDDCTAIAFMLRNVCGYHLIDAKEFVELAIHPIVHIYNRFGANIDSLNTESCHFDCAKLIENGNKLKVFQIAQISPHQWSNTNIDALLFELGTLSPIGSYDTQSLHSASDTYFKKIIENNSLSVFNNWKALSLFDTFTMLSCDCPTWLFNNWIDDYFGMIYISQLYKRYYLFRTNQLFKFSKVGIETLSNEFMRFERHHCFYKISYNFLPQSINQSIENGLEIDDEKRELYHMIDQENVQREKNDDGRMNKLLFFLTCVTLFSAVWDTTCLLNELYPFESYWGSQMIGFRIVAYSLTLIMICAIVANRSFKKK